MTYETIVKAVVGLRSVRIVMIQGPGNEDSHSKEYSEGPPG